MKWLSFQISVVQRQTAVTAYLKSKQLQLFDFTLQIRIHAVPKWHATKSKQQ